ncbi:MAG: retention module-containing protein, partial [Pseudomonas sp.]
MATLIGVVSQVVGEVFAVAGDGARRPLAEGDRVYAGEQLVTGAGGSIAIALTNGQELTVGRDSSITLNEQMIAGADNTQQESPQDQKPDAPSDAELTDVEKLQAAIEAGVDPTLNAEATAAGPGAGGGGAGGAGGIGGGHSFVLLGETGGALDPTIGFPTAGLNTGPLFPDPDPIVTPDPAAPDFTPDVDVEYEDAQGQVVTGPAIVDEEGLGDGTNPGSNAEQATGQLVVNSPDGVSSLQIQDFNGNWVDVTNGGVVQGQYGVLTVDASGGWTYVLTDNTLNHGNPNATGAADQVGESFGVRVFDLDGDVSPTVQLNVLVNDDGPILEGGEGAQVFNVVDEDETSDGNTDGDSISNVATGAAGSLTALVNFGADGVGSFGLTGSPSAIASLEAQGLSSGETALTYSVLGNVLTASAGSETIFTLQVGGDGSYTFTLLGQLDHPTPDGNDDEYLNGGIDFSAVLAATDGDGDSVGAFNPGSFVINVEDDVPQLVEQREGGVFDQVQEDALTLGSGAPFEGNDEGGQTTTATGEAGTLSTLVNFGADGPGGFGLSSDLGSMDAQALSSGGVPLSYSVEDGVLTATAGSGGPEVFALTVNADGSYSFELKGPIDHPDQDGNDYETLPGLGIDFSGVLTAVDGDGDPLPGGFPPGSFTIDIEDDVPELAGIYDGGEGGSQTDYVKYAPSVGGTVHEDALTQGEVFSAPHEGNNEDSDPVGQDSDPAQTLVASGGESALHVLVNFGADGPGDFGLSDSDGAYDWMDGLGLTSAGEALEYNIDATTGLLTASVTGYDVFTLQVNADGSYTFTLKGPLDHPAQDGNDSETLGGLGVDFSGVLTATDGDGDPLADGFPRGSFTINVEDDVPTLAGRDPESGPVGGQVNEDPLSSPYNGNDDASQNLVVSTATGAGSLSGLVAFGADGPGDFGLVDTAAATALLNAQGLESGGEGLVYTVAQTFDLDGNLVSSTLTAVAAASVGGYPVFTLEIEADGDFTFTLQGPVDHSEHSDNDDENWVATDDSAGIDFTALLTATDGDGDPVAGLAQAEGLFVINVEDDVPVLADRGEESRPVGGQVNEDPLSSPHNGNDDASQALVVSTATGAGSLSGLVAFGADGPGDFGLVDTAAATALLSAQGLESGGEELVYTVAQTFDLDGNLVSSTLTAVAAASVGGYPVFTLVVEADGDFTFTLQGPVDHSEHSDNDDENWVAADDSAGIDFTALLTATDGDGDPVDGLAQSEGLFVINVEDDVPVLADRGEESRPVGGQVNEDPLSSPYNGNDDASQALVVSTSTGAGSLSGLVAFGADGPGDFGLVDTSAATALLNAQGLTSGGEGLVYTVAQTFDLDGNLVNSTLTAVAAASVGGYPVFTLVVEAGGDFSFTLQGPIDHPEHSDNDDENWAAADDSAGIDFTALLTATDGDGDPLAGLAQAEGLFVINVEDDVPVQVQGGTITGETSVDEDSLVPHGIDDGADGVDASASGSLSGLISFGADGPGEFSLLDDTSGLPALTSNGQPVEYDVDGDTLSAFVPGVDGYPVFTFTLDSSGNYTFTLTGQLDHPDKDGNDDTDILPIDLSSIVQATDGDSDPVVLNNSVIINVEDDVPVARDNEATTTESSLPPFNLTLIIDSSGSMSSEVMADLDGDGVDESTTRLDVAKAALFNLIDSYVALGVPLNFKIIDFDTNAAKVYEGTDASDAKDAIASLVAGGITEYDDALDLARDELEQDLLDPALDGYVDRVYFLSDGQPNPASDDAPPGWQTFVDSNNIDVIAVGIQVPAVGAAATELGEVGNAGDTVLIVQDPNELSTALGETVPDPLQGNVISDAGPAGVGDVDQSGADHPLRVTQVSFVNAAGATITVLVPAGGSSVPIDTPAGGTLVMSSDGHWSYVAPNNVTDDTQEVFTYTIVDADGDPDTATLTITVTDGVPLAVNDSASMTEDTDTVSGSVITNDNVGTDDPGSVSFASTTGSYGSLIYNPNGGWTYDLNNASPVVQGLGVGQSLTETFNYTLSDSDGDTSPATLTITINGVDDQVSIFGLNGNDETVDEDDLPAGTDSTKEPLTQTGTFTVTAPDGLLNLSVGSINVVTNGVANVPQSITTPFGHTLAITAFDPATGVVSYSYTLTGNEPHPDAGGENSITESFTVTAQDIDLDSGNASLDVRIVDDVPQVLTANENFSVDEDDLPAGNDVSKESLTVNGSIFDNVNWGADGFGGVTGVTAASGSPTTTATATTITLSTSDWQLVVTKATGAYAFTLLDEMTHANASGENSLTLPTFTVTAVDGDGDPASVTLNASVVDDIPSVTTANENFSVDEDDLPAGTDSSKESLVINGTIADNVNWGADGFGGVTSVSVAGGSPASVDNGATITLSTVDWQLVVTKATGAYAFTLLDEMTHANASGENSLTLPTFTVNAVDGDG